MGRVLENYQRSKTAIAKDGCSMIMRTDYNLLPRLIDYYGVTFDHLMPADELNPTSLKWTMTEDNTRMEGNTRTKSFYFPSIRQITQGRKYSLCGGTRHDVNGARDDRYA